MSSSTSRCQPRCGRWTPTPSSRTRSPRGVADYLQHGRRHGTGGSDPILGLAASLDWCYANGDIDTDGSSHPSLSNLKTSNGSVFALNGGSDGIDITAD